MWSTNFRKLVLLKLEKGYNFGDVLLDGTIPHHEYDSKTLSSEVLTSTLFNQVSSFSFITSISQRFITNLNPL